MSASAALALAYDDIESSVDEFDDIESSIDEFDGANGLIGAWARKNRLGVGRSRVEGLEYGCFPLSALVGLLLFVLSGGACCGMLLGA